jgi:hypothetical protein
MHDRGGVLQRDAHEVAAEFLADLEVHLVVDQPQRDLGDLRREFLDLDAVELIDVDGDQLVNVEHLLAVDVRGAQHVEFQQAQLAVGDGEKIAAAAGRVEKGQAAQFLVELEQLVAVALIFSNSARRRRGTAA